MALIYTLSTPITIGDFNNSINVSSLKLVSISINYEDVYSKNGTAVLSICLADPVTGYPCNVVYQDATALQMAQTIEAQVGAELFRKLIADGKLPQGVLADAGSAPPTSDQSQSISGSSPSTSVASS